MYIYVYKDLYMYMTDINTSNTVPLLPLDCSTAIPQLGSGAPKLNTFQKMYPSLLHILY